MSFRTRIGRLEFDEGHEGMEEDFHSDHEILFSWKILV